jgi:ParB family transcriptional regulator, chromosome partitioning protein
METDRQKIDLHRLDMRFAGTRVADPPAIERLARSIEQNGQIVACIAVASRSEAQTTDGNPDAGLVLIDGYRRVAALRRLVRDTVDVAVWSCSIAEALLFVLARSDGRTLAAVEEAMLLRELVHGAGLSQHEAARRCGRDVSWVNRRLALLSALPDKALVAVREGCLSIWAASRVLCPLARANGDHADRLLSGLAGASLTTRDLLCWFDHYQKASKAARERMVDQPGLLLDAVREREEQRDGTKLRRGPEGECADDLRIIEAVIARLRKRLAAIGPLPGFLGPAIARMKAALAALTDEIERYGNEDRKPAPTSGADPGGAGQGAP